MMNRYEEKQTLHPIINVLYIIMVGALIWAAWGEPGPLLLLILVSAILSVIPLIFGKLVIRVDDETLHVVFG